MKRTIGRFVCVLLCVGMSIISVFVSPLDEFDRYATSMVYQPNTAQVEQIAIPSFTSYVEKGEPAGYKPDEPQVIAELMTPPAIYAQITGSYTPNTASRSYVPLNIVSGISGVRDYSHYKI